MSWKQNQQLVRCTSCYFIWLVLKTKQKRSTVRGCVCVSVLGREGNWVFASKALVVVWTTMYLTGYSDWLTGFGGPLSPPYRCHTSLKNVKVPPCTKYHPSVFHKTTVWRVTIVTCGLDTHTVDAGALLFQPQRWSGRRPLPSSCRGSALPCPPWSAPSWSSWPVSSSSRHLPPGTGPPVWLPPLTKSRSVSSVLHITFRSCGSAFL